MLFYIKNLLALLCLQNKIQMLYQSRVGCPIQMPFIRTVRQIPYPIYSHWFAKRLSCTDCKGRVHILVVVGFLSSEGLCCHLRNPQGA